MHEQQSETSRKALHNCTVLSLRVRNHPGVMSHVCGLFARRAFNLGMRSQDLDFFSTMHIVMV